MQKEKAVIEKSHINTSVVRELASNQIISTNSPKPNKQFAVERVQTLEQPAISNLCSAYAPKSTIKKPVLKMPNPRGKSKAVDSKSNNYKEAEDDVERKTFCDLNANEQHTFSKYRTITPQSTTDDSANVGKSQEDELFAVQPPPKKTKALPQATEGKPQTTTPMAKGQNQLRVTKRLRQGTGESNKMRSSHYEHMKEARNTYVPTIIDNAKLRSPKKAVRPTHELTLSPKTEKPDKSSNLETVPLHRGGQSHSAVVNANLQVTKAHSVLDQNSHAKQMGQPLRTPFSDHQGRSNQQLGE